MGRTTKKIKTENVENEAPSNTQNLQQQTNEVLRNHFSQSPALKKQSTPSPVVSPSSAYSIIVRQVQSEVESINIRKKIQQLEQQLQKIENSKNIEENKNNDLKYFETHEDHEHSKLNEKKDEEDINSKDQLFGKHWKQDEMDLLSNGIYCKKMIRAMAESCSYKASHVARRLIEGVYKRDALVKHTFTGKSNGKFCGVLDQTAKKAIIDFAMNLNKNKGWQSQTVYDINRAMSQKVSEIKRTYKDV